MIHYFAYGSNMLTRRLQARCASAKVRLVAWTNDWTVTFSKRSLDGSGKATLSPATGRQMFGVVFDLEEHDLPVLDQFEGAGKGYDRTDNFPVYIAGSQYLLRAITYIANPCHIDAKLEPYDWYLNLIIAGARQHGLPFDHVSSLEVTPSSTDPMPDRKLRLEALELLARK